MWYIYIMARPTEYKKEYCEKVDEYLVLCQDTFDTNKLKVKLPTIEGFATFLDVSKKTLYNWGDENPLFLHALQKINHEQKERLFNMGLSGDYNSTIAKLILSSNHGMSEKTISESKVTMEVNNLSELPDDELANIATASQGGVS